MSTARPKIGVGYRVGLLTVTDRTDKTKSGYSIWRCSCECGGEIFLDTRCLQRGTVKDCGCNSVVKPGMADLSAIRFGKLVCLEPAGTDGKGNTLWLCECDCGNTCIAKLGQLRAGYKRSCGCLSHPPLKDYLGKRFGKLTVTEYAGKEKGQHRWKCLCDCGNVTVVGQTLLQSGKTKSCGCLQKKQLTENLRLIDGTSVTKLEAMLDREPILSNTSGYNGVYLNKRSGKWTAQITFKSKTYYLGSYTDIADAVKARKRGEEMYDDFLEWYYSEHSEKIKRKNKERNTP